LHVLVLMDGYRCGSVYLSKWVVDANDIPQSGDDGTSSHGGISQYGCPYLLLRWRDATEGHQPLFQGAIP